MASPNLSERAHTQTCIEHGQRLRNEGKLGVPGGRRLWRQMLIGFICAASLGVIMLILGSVFIGNAVKGDTSITVMLCVLGMVCGLIILVGTGILGKMLLSRKMRTGEGQLNRHHHPDACPYACSIIYTPSQDQLNGPVFQDPPPAYEMVIFSRNQQRLSDENSVAGSIEFNDGTRCTSQPVLMSPPKYSIAAAPLPQYGDPV
ncbi:uncharacterized protein LOC123563069 [Mercenaria mercenaria]|uniref:uncharacterized protein LOC123563069 n=1 Tax=Mercenaria mercenaria TaxID=6596 RepID=UPI00234E7197|nr:uncharacterized protein LOC123563069 [Mercenaria mercenaria]XP_045211581.2 uncharacterized protein LOC123563069 [Mercenaria mercenaria]XP_045211582.2 uncharacterized protein LOC123563069 [Mercenaria mercenaria]